MKVFKMNTTDHVAAKSKKDAVEFYFKEYGDDAELTFCREVDVNKEGMWYGFNEEEVPTWDSLKKLILTDRNIKDIENTPLKMEVKFDCRGFYLSVFLSFQNALILDQKTEPYIICSTEY
jgi:hypothetical protein